MSTIGLTGWPALVVALCMLGSYALRKFTPKTGFLHDPAGAFLLALASATCTAFAQAIAAHGLSWATLGTSSAGAIFSLVGSANPSGSGAVGNDILRALLPLALLGTVSGCATAQQTGTIAADGLLATSRAVRAVSSGLPASARTPTVIADFQHVATALQVAAALVPVSCSASAPATLQAASQAVSDAFAALLRDLAAPAPHTAALSTTDALAIAAAVVGGLSALIPGGIAIYNAVHAVPGPDACAAAAKALQEDVATLPAALSAP